MRFFTLGKPFTDSKSFRSVFNFSTTFSSITYKRFINEKSAIRFTYFRPVNKTIDAGKTDWADNKF